MEGGIQFFIENQSNELEKLMVVIILKVEGKE
jgi:hypothetical protein